MSCSCFSSKLLSITFFISILISATLVTVSIFYNSLIVSQTIGSRVAFASVISNNGDQGNFVRGSWFTTKQSSCSICKKKLSLSTLDTAVELQQQLNRISQNFRKLETLGTLTLPMQVVLGNYIRLPSMMTQGSFSISLILTMSLTRWLSRQSCYLYLEMLKLINFEILFIPNCIDYELIYFEINLQMQSNIKQRILSQQHRNPYQKAFRQDRNVPRTLKKIASLYPQSSSVTKAMQKLGRAAHNKYQEEVQSKERRRDANQNESTEFVNEKNNFMRKVSQNNLRNIEHLGQKNELINYKSSLHVLANAEYGEKNKLQKLKKNKDIQRIYFTKGNNHQLLKELFIDKYGFSQTSVRENASICWLQSSNQKDNSKILSKSIHQEHLPDIKRRKVQNKVIYNYLEGQSQLTNKQKLYKNMSRAYPQAIGTYIPKSFIIDFRLDEAQIQQNLLQFMAYYFKKDKNKRPRNKSIVIKNYYADITVSNKQLNRLIEKSEQLDQDKHQKSIEQQKNDNDQLWILKPTYLNRGRGIHLFATLKQLSKLLSQTPFQISVKMYSDNAKPMTYIIQEYIDRPLLIDGYKFDMRFWVMLQVVKLQGKKALKAYLFQKGYIRLASVKYELAADKQEQNPKEEIREDKQNSKKQKKAYINNKFIHLTNNAVQKDAKQYGQFCEGNQLSLQTMMQYFQQRNQKCPLNLQQLQQNVAKIVRESVSCIKDKLIDLNHIKTFQLLGYDFLLDQNYKMWLIEANCNPCLQQSSTLVADLLRQMISGLIHLTHLSQGKGPNQSQGWVQLF